MHIKVNTRFAPSPTGHLHLGHAYSAFFAYELANATRGNFILRIEDIDITRKKDNLIQDIYTDLHWLGLKWQQPVRLQSKYFEDYTQQLDKLKKLGVIYPCYCSRKQIAQKRDTMLHAPHGVRGNIYPQTCKNRNIDEIKDLENQGIIPAYRLDFEKSLSLLSEPLPNFWNDLLMGKQPLDLSTIGDVILARRDIQTSYHMAVTYDDNLQDISLITRGVDLMEQTPLHMLLQRLIGYNTPYYAHHDLLCDKAGNRLAKSHGAISLKQLRKQGISPEQIRKQMGIGSPEWYKKIEQIVGMLHLPTSLRERY
ncbi:MAG: tRNA glutamyl-Q(34) synthetase GluQRS [Alphaproteobacteria bacterium]